MVLKKPWAGLSFGQTLPAVLYINMCMRLGRSQKALEVISRAWRRSRRATSAGSSPLCHRLPAARSWRRTDPKEAEHCFATAIEVARKQSSTILELRATRSLHAVVAGARKKKARDDIARLLALISGGQDTQDVIEAKQAVEG